MFQEKVIYQRVLLLKNDLLRYVPVHLKSFHKADNPILVIKWISVEKIPESEHGKGINSAKWTSPDKIITVIIRTSLKIKDQPDALYCWMRLISLFKLSVGQLSCSILSSGRTCDPSKPSIQDRKLKVTWSDQI